MRELQTDIISEKQYRPPSSYVFSETRFRILKGFFLWGWFIPSIKFIASILNELWLIKAPISNFTAYKLNYRVILSSLESYRHTDFSNAEDLLHTIRLLKKLNGVYLKLIFLAFTCISSRFV